METPRPPISSVDQPGRSFKIFSNAARFFPKERSEEQTTDWTGISQTGKGKIRHENTRFNQKA
jgi:hypothetical protein